MPSQAIPLQTIKHDHVNKAVFFLTVLTKAASKLFLFDGGRPLGSLLASVMTLQLGDSL